MTRREQFIRTLQFEPVDRVPLMPGEPRESTLSAWRTQGLPPEADWRAQLAEIMGLSAEDLAPVETLPVDFRLIPQFDEKVLAHEGGHYIVQDWKGNVCEISDRYDVTYLRLPRDFVTRRWLRCPVETRDDWEHMKERYDAAAAGRLPTDLEEQCRAVIERDRVLVLGVSGPFWQMREWCGFEGLCMLMVEQPDWVAEMATFHSEFVSAVLTRVLRRVVPDVLHVSEDMAYKGKAMISPEMTRAFCMPGWKRWGAQVRDAGCPLFDIDSDGFVGDLIPLWIESGVNVCDPVEVAAMNDIVEFRRRFGRRMAYRGGVDKRAMARGGRAIRDELRRIRPVISGGGFIPGCDHGIPADVSWTDYLEYVRMLAELTGWR